MSEVVNEENHGRQPLIKAKKDRSCDIFSIQCHGGQGGQGVGLKF